MKVENFIRKQIPEYSEYLPKFCIPYKAKKGDVGISDVLMHSIKYILNDHDVIIINNYLTMEMPIDAT
jgi:hypothetical protein